MADKAVEENLTLTPTECNQDENVPGDMKETSELSLVPEDTNRPGIICSSSSGQETQNIPSSSKTNSETGETSVERIRILHSQRPYILPNLVDHGESSDEMEVFTEETNVSVSKRRFTIPSEAMSDVRPVITVSDEKDSGFDEIVVKNPAKQLIIDVSQRTEHNYSTFSKNLSRTGSTTSEDTLPDHGVYVSEESSMSSSDVSHSFTSLNLAESVDSGLKLPLVESPSPPLRSKRKISDSDLPNEDCSDKGSKKGRILPVEVSSESTQITDEELKTKSAASARSEAGDAKTDEGPLIEFPEDLEICSKSQQGSKSTKRTFMVLREVEDVTDYSSDSKRNKSSD